MQWLWAAPPDPHPDKAPCAKAARMPVSQRQTHCLSCLACTHQMTPVGGSMGPCNTFTSPKASMQLLHSLAEHFMATAAPEYKTLHVIAHNTNPSGVPQCRDCIMTVWAWLPAVRIIIASQVIQLKMRSTVAIQQHLQHHTILKQGSWSLFNAVLSIHKSIENHNKNLVQSLC